MDTGIYLCEPDVLALFSDNWDYQVRLAPGHCQADMSVGPSLGICISALRCLPFLCTPISVLQGRSSQAFAVPRRTCEGT